MKKALKYILYLAAIYGVYSFFKSRKQAGQKAVSPEDARVDLGGKFGLVYIGPSALRPVGRGADNCGVPGNPFTTPEMQGQRGQNMVAGTNFFAAFRLVPIGDYAADIPGFNKGSDGNYILKPGDKFSFTMTGGAASYLDNHVFTVQQNGTDNCRAAGVAEGMGNVVVTDFLIIPEGAQDPTYFTADAYGTGSMKNQ